jgi:hypothetical protein
MTKILLLSLAFSLVLTITLEIIFFLLTKKRNKKDLLLLLLVNVLTNPIVVLSFWLMTSYTDWISYINTDWNRYIILIPLELFAVLTEGYYYKKYGCDFRRPYLFSLTANMFSFWSGVVIQQLV